MTAARLNSTRTLAYRFDPFTGADTAQFANKVISTVDIPDPGYNYQLQFFGHLFVDPGDGTGIDISVQDGAGGTNGVLSSMTRLDGAAVGNQGGRLPFPITGFSPVLAGFRTIALTITKWKGGSGDGFTYAAAPYSTVTALLVGA